MGAYEVDKIMKEAIARLGEDSKEAAEVRAFYEELRPRIKEPRLVILSEWIIIVLVMNLWILSEKWIIIVLKSANLILHFSEIKMGLF